MRVVVGHHVADDTRALHERAVGPQVRVVHRPEDAPLHRLQAVAHVGQRALHDDAHRVLEERGLDLLLQRARRHVGDGGGSSVNWFVPRAMVLRDGPSRSVLPTRRGSGRLWRSAGSRCGARSTSSPISTDRCRRRSRPGRRRAARGGRVAGSMHVSRSSGGSISPRPLNRANASWRFGCSLHARAAAPRRRRRTASAPPISTEYSGGCATYSRPCSTSGVICR